MLRSFMSAYPWDLLDEGLETSLDRLQGEIGIGGLTLWAAVPALIQSRVRNVDPKVFRTWGGVLYHPEAHYYSASRCKPLICSWLNKHKNPIEAICRACRERGIEVRAALSIGRMGRMADRHPETACKNAFADVSPADLCLANPDVQTLVSGLITELTATYPLQGIVLYDWGGLINATGPFPAYTSFVALGLDGELEQNLLSLCFCESCQQKAMRSGVNVQASLEKVCALLQSSLERGVASRMDMNTWLEQEPHLVDFLQWRRRELELFLGLLSEACSTNLVFFDDSEALGIQFLKLREIAGGSIQNLRLLRVIENRADFDHFMAQSCGRPELVFPSQFVIRREPNELVSTVVDAAKSGVAAISFEHYGEIPDAFLTPIKRAIRFARRESENA